MRWASRREFVAGAFLFTAHPGKGNPLRPLAISELHSSPERRGMDRCFGRSSWYLVPELGREQRFGGTSRVQLAQSKAPASDAQDAVSNPTTQHNRTPGGVAERFKAPIQGIGTREGLEGSFPSSTTEHRSGAPYLDNDRVVQRRRAGRRTPERPAPPSPKYPQHAAMGRWPGALCRGAEPPGS